MPWGRLIPKYRMDNGEKYLTDVGGGGLLVLTNALPSLCV